MIAAIYGRRRTDRGVGEGSTTTLLLLASPLERPLDRGQGLRGVDEREGAQAEGVCHEAGEGVGAYLAFACARLGLDDPEQTGRYAGAVPCVYVAEIERLIFRAAATHRPQRVAVDRGAARRAAPAYRPRDVGGLPGGASAMTAWQDPARLHEWSGEEPIK